MAYQSRGMNPIKTKGRFNMMDLPTEIRLKIYAALLISGEVNISQETTTDQPEVPFPSTAILQTCKRINEEGTPILYSKNKFTFRLSRCPISNVFQQQSSAVQGPSPSCNPPAHTLFFTYLRWSSISLLQSISFSSTTTDIPSWRHRPVFTCSASDILDRFSANELRYSPEGLSEYMALSVSNWISTELMKEELQAIVKDMEALLKPSKAVLEAMSDDPAT